MDRSVVLDVLRVRGHHVLQVGRLLFQHSLEEGGVGLLRDEREQVANCRGDIAGDRVLHCGAASDVPALDVHLGGLRVPWEELGVREVGAQQDEQVGVLEGVEHAP